jgi:hypothetical protein
MDFIEKLIDNPTTKVECKYCGELTKVYKSDKNFLFVQVVKINNCMIQNILQVFGHCVNRVVDIHKPKNTKYV